MENALRGDRRIALPYQSLGSFVRIATNPRILTEPMSAAEAWSFVDDWLAPVVAWVPPTSRQTLRIAGQLCVTHGVTGNLVPDAMLAALAIEHGLSVVSADADFARFPEVVWINPLRV